MERISPFFPLAHGVPHVDDHHVLSGIVYVIRNVLQWKDAPKAYGCTTGLFGGAAWVSLIGSSSP